MLKKIIYYFCIICSCLLASSVPVQATNWFYLFDGGEGTRFYWDTESYSYNAATQIASCTYRMLDEAAGEEYQLRYCFDLEKKRSALQFLRVYKQGQLVHTANYPRLTFKEVRPRTNEDYMFSLLLLARDLTAQKIHWEFNTITLPPPSPWNSPNWEGGDNALQVYLDQSTKYKNDREKAAWFRTGNTVQWYRFDLVHNHAAVYEQLVYKDGQLLSHLIYPLIIWTDDETRYTPQAQKLFLRQSALCFRMQQGVALDG